MPLWDFFCVNCQSTTELLLPNLEHAKKAKCKICKGKLSRLASAATPKFVGKGFYETDYKTKA